MNVQDKLEPIGEVASTCKRAYRLKVSKHPEILMALKCEGYVEKLVTLTNGKELKAWVQAN